MTCTGLGLAFQLRDKKLSRRVPHSRPLASDNQRHSFATSSACLPYAGDLQPPPEGWPLLFHHRGGFSPISGAHRRLLLLLPHLLLPHRHLLPLPIAHGSHSSFACHAAGESFCPPWCAGGSVGGLSDQALSFQGLTTITLDSPWPLSGNASSRYLRSVTIGWVATCHA